MARLRGIAPAFLPASPWLCLIAILVATLFMSASETLAGAGRRHLPAVSVSAAPTKTSAGSMAQFTVQTNRVNPTSDIVVNYAMTGTAVASTDYSSPASSGTVTIPAGSSSTSVIMNTLALPVSKTSVATLRLQAGTGYRVSTPSRSSVTIVANATPTPSPTPTPSSTPAITPTPTPTPSPQQEIWIAIRSDGLAGSGTLADPFDGGTAQKFDAILGRYQATPNFNIHLTGAGPFQTDVHHGWFLRSGWVLSGDGMYSTTLQLVGSLAGIYNFAAVSTDPNLATDNVTVRDLTIDCNWPALGSTAPDGANGEKYFTLNALNLRGSNNLVERVRHINSYGSWENRREGFAFYLASSPLAPGINNVIRDCRAELPRGTYGNPFALAGLAAAYPITNSKVVGCTAVGINDGLNHGFTSGGVNLAWVKDCEVDGNTFIDCEGATYLDVGTIDGLRVTNNKVVRGWKGVGLVSISTKQNIVISGNDINVQNRYPTGSSMGIAVGSGPENQTIINSNVMISNNTISFDTSGRGQVGYWGIGASLLNGATVSDNTIGVVYPLSNNAVGINVTLSNNWMSDGSPVVWRPY